MKNLLLLLLIAATNYANAQCTVNVTEDFSSSTGWTVLGSGAAGITNGKFELIEAYSEWDERAYKALPCTLTGFPWRLDFDFKPIDLHTGVGPNGYIALTANNSDGMCLPEYGGNNPNWTQNTMLRVTYDASYGAGGSSCYFNTIWRKNTAQDYSNRFIPSSYYPVGSGTTTYYPRLERIDATHCRLSVFTNAARTVHSGNSPYCFTIDADIDNFNYLQVGANNEGIGSRVMSAELDNIHLQNNIPIPDVTTFAAPITGRPYICPSSSTTLNAYQSGYTNYIWSNGNNTYNNTVQQAGTYTVSVTSTSGCIGTGQVVVTNGVPPRPSIAGSNVPCGASSTLLTASDAGAPINTTAYRWNNQSTSAAISAGAGTYSVTVTNLYGCTGTSSISITQLTVPQAPYLSIQGNNIAVANPQTGATYQWYRAGVLIPNATNLTYTIENTAVYTVCASTGANCQSCSSPIQLGYLGTADTHSIALQISPNPTSGDVFLAGLPNTKHQIRVFSSIGQLVFATQNNAPNYALDMSGYPSGVYLLQIENETWKLVKE